MRVFFCLKQLYLETSIEIIGKTLFSTKGVQGLLSQFFVEHMKLAKCVGFFVHIDKMNQIST